MLDEDSLAALAGMLLLFIIGTAFLKGLGWI